MGSVTNNAYHLSLQALLTSQQGGKALKPIGAVEVLGGFVLAAGPHA